MQTMASWIWTSNLSISASRYRETVTLLTEIAGALALGWEFGALHNADKHFFMNRMHQMLVFMNMVREPIFTPDP